MEATTHVVYDVIKILLFFLYIHALRASPVVLLKNNYLNAFLAGSLALLLLLLQLRRYRILKSRISLYPVLSAVGIFSISLVVGVQTVSAMTTSVILTVFYYLFSALLHHKIEGSFSFKIMFEYFIIGLLAIVILINLVF